MRTFMALASLTPILASLPLLGAYGDTVTVPVKLTTIISPGWVVTAQSYSGPRFYTPHFPTTCFMTLKQLAGAPLGAEEEILGQSPVPAGWTIVSTKGNTGVDRLSYNIRHRIRNLSAAPPAAGESAAPELPAVTEAAEVVYDIAGIDWKRQDAEKKAATEEKKAQDDAEKAKAKAKQEEEQKAAAERNGFWHVTPRGYTR